MTTKKPTTKRTDKEGETGEPETVEPDQPEPGESNDRASRVEDEEEVPQPKNGRKDEK